MVDKNRMKHDKIIREKICAKCPEYDGLHIGCYPCEACKVLDELLQEGETTTKEIGKFIEWYLKHGR